MIQQEIEKLQKNTKKVLAALLTLLIITLLFTLPSCKSMSGIPNVPSNEQAERILKSSKEVLAGDTVVITTEKPPMQQKIFLRGYDLHIHSRIKVDSNFVDALQAARIIDSLLNSQNERTKRAATILLERRRKAAKKLNRRERRKAEREHKAAMRKRARAKMQK